MGDLRSAFLAFCDFTKKGSTTCNDKTLKKICTDCKLYSKEMDANRVDIQFRRHIGNAKKDVDCADFVSFIEGALSEAYASARKISKEEAIKQIKEKVAKGNPNLNNATQVVTMEAVDRLADVARYTGTHKERFDAETGKGKGIAGREDLADNTGYVQGYKDKDTYDDKHK
ncbi:Tubulin polymerization-promoting protein family member 3 [Taenia solium]|eukprot:TsM_000372500 transcript=TsM_000372500 gene=TsM_000372500